MSRYVSVDGKSKISRGEVSQARRGGRGQLETLIKRVYAPGSTFSQVDFARELIAELGDEDSAFKAIQDYSGLSSEEMDKHKTEVRRAAMEPEKKVPEHKQSLKEQQWKEDSTLNKFDRRKNRAA